MILIHSTAKESERKLDPTYNQDMIMQDYSRIVRIVLDVNSCKIDSSTSEYQQYILETSRLHCRPLMQAHAIDEPFNV